MILAAIALSALSIAPQPVQSAPTPDTSVIQMAANLCGALFSTDIDLQTCMEAQEQAYTDISTTLRINGARGRDFMPVLAYCIEQEFVHPEAVNLPAIRQCFIETIAQGNV